MVESSMHIAIYLLLNIPSSIGQNSTNDIFFPITFISGLFKVLSNSKYNNSLFSNPITNWLFVALAQFITLDDFKKVVFFSVFICRIPLGKTCKKELSFIMLTCRDGNFVSKKLLLHSFKVLYFSSIS